MQVNTGDNSPVKGNSESSTQADATSAKVHMTALQTFKAMHPITKLLLAIASSTIILIPLVATIINSVKNTHARATDSSERILAQAAQQQDADPPPGDQSPTIASVAKILPTLKGKNSIKAEGGTAIAQGNKREQQDRTIEGRVQWGGEWLTFSGVADGHADAGHDAAAYIKRHLINDLNIALNTSSQRTPARFNQTVKKLLHKYNTELQGMYMVTQGGSTLTGALISKSGEIYTLNAGDSKTIRVGPQDVQQLSVEQSYNKEHRRFIPDPPPNATEMKTNTIKWSDEKYTYVQRSINDELKYQYRFDLETYNAALDPSKPLGTTATYDLELKFQPGAIYGSNHDSDNYCQPYSEIGLPDVDLEPETTYTQAAEEDYIISASDGVWDFLTNQEVANLVREMKSQGFNETKMAEYITAAALGTRIKKNSPDNISVTIHKVGD